MENNKELLTPMQLSELVKPNEGTIIKSTDEMYNRIMEYVEVDHDGMVVLSSGYYDSNISILISVGEEDTPGIALMSLELEVLLPHLKENIRIREESLEIDKKDYNSLMETYNG